MTEPQNVYDDPAFLAGYSTLERFGAGWEGAMEQPYLLGLLPDVTELRVLDLGCGAGQLAKHLADAGAAEVVGVDVSEQMLALARKEFAHPRVTYVREAIETVSYEWGRFDVVVSALAFHYVEDYRGLVRRIASWLPEGGVLAFSMEHPLFTGRLPGEGWVTDEGGRRVGWNINHYNDEGVRPEHWFVEGVRKVHRTFSTLINGLVEAGLVVDRIIEPMPTEDWFSAHPDSEYAAPANVLAYRSTQTLGSLTRIMACRVRYLTARLANRARVAAPSVG